MKSTVSRDGRVFGEGRDNIRRGRGTCPSPVAPHTGTAAGALATQTRPVEIPENGAGVRLGVGTTAGPAVLAFFYLPWASTTSACVG